MKEKKEKKDIDEIVYIYKSAKTILKFFSKKYVWVPLVLFILYLYIDDPRHNFFGMILNHIHKLIGSK